MIIQELDTRVDSRKDIEVVIETTGTIVFATKDHTVKLNPKETETVLDYFQKMSLLIPDEILAVLGYKIFKERPIVRWFHRLTASTFTKFQYAEFSRMLKIYRARGGDSNGNQVSNPD